MANEPVGLLFDMTRCGGCRACVLSCMKTHGLAGGFETAPECDLCLGRLDRGESPACAASCRHEATVFGLRQDLIAQAHRRIAESPWGYHPHVHGEHEAGGTTVLFLTPHPVEEPGFGAAAGAEPYLGPSTVVQCRVPAVVLCGGEALYAFWWTNRHRDEVAAARQAAACAAHLRARRQHGIRAKEDVDVEHRA